MCSGSGSQSKQHEAFGDDIEQQHRHVHSSKADSFPFRAEVLHQLFCPSAQDLGAGTPGVYWEKARDAAQG